MITPASPARLMTLGLMIGLALIVSAVAWVGVWQERALLSIWFGGDLFSQIALGALIGLTFSLTLWEFGKHLEGFRFIRERLATTIDLTALRDWQIVALSLMAAFPEEIFFRGALQFQLQLYNVVLGLIVAALIFGILHAMTSFYFAYATLAGLGLGLLAQWQGGLWTPIATHFVVDAVGLWLLRRWANEHPIVLSSPEGMIYS